MAWLKKLSMKKCSICGAEKLLTEFHSRAASPDGLQPKCKICQKKLDRAYYEEHRSQFLEKARQWGRDNPEERKIIEARYRKNHRQQQNFRTQNYRARKREVTLESGWEVGTAWWKDLVFRFGNKCVYCRREVKLTLDHVTPLARGGRHSPDNIVPACGSCNYTKRDRLLEELGWTCYAPSGGIREEAMGLMAAQPVLSYQRAIREVVAAREGAPAGAPATMADAQVTPITNKQAAEIILKYEWLGTMGRPQAAYGLWLPVGGVYTLAGAMCFGFATGSQAGNVCGSAYSTKAIALERGACVHWAPKNAASWFVSRAVTAASRDRGWVIFYAYSDPEAREVGTIYQACNWLYLGIGPGHGPTRELWSRPDGIKVSSRALRYRGLSSDEAVAAGWRKEVVPARGKYVWFEGTPKLKKKLRRLLVHPPQPYPKRVAVI